MALIAHYSTLAAWPLAICRALQAHGVDPDPLLNTCDLSREALQSNPDGRVDIRLMTRFWGEVRGEEGSSYRELLKQCRMETADYYLRHTGLSVTDIALKAGFPMRVTLPEPWSLGIVECPFGNSIKTLSS